MCNVHIYRLGRATVFWESKSNLYIKIGGDDIAGGLSKIGGMLKNYAEEIAGYISLTAVTGFLIWLLSSTWEIAKYIPYYI